MTYEDVLFVYRSSRRKGFLGSRTLPLPSIPSRQLSGLLVIGNRRTIYSLRDTYAPFRLQEGVHQSILARNMGTNTAMLEKHYGHTSKVVNVAELIKRTGGSKTRKVGAVDWLME